MFSFSHNFQKSKQEEIRVNIENEEIKIICLKPKFEGLRVLLTEDNLVNIKLMQKNFEGTGMFLDTAEDCEICIEKLKINKYDIILMDLFMPVMDGNSTTHYIRNIMNLNIPIIGLSANTSEELKKKGYEAGMNYYITKPFKIHEIFSTICRSIQNVDRKQIPQNIIKPKKKTKLNESSIKTNNHSNFQNISRRNKGRKRSLKKMSISKNKLSL